MSSSKAKRFWDKARAETAEGGFSVTLDGRPLRTPAKAGLILPGRALAEAIAQEWDAQEGRIDPGTMPLTRTANAAIDKVAEQKHEVAELLAAYGDSDLLCYRATAPEALVARQQAVWDPLLDWAAGALGARLNPVSGVIHAPQNPQALARLAGQVHAFDPFELAAFHDLVGLSGSLVIGFAVTWCHRPTEELWTASRLDEIWQEEQWGKDDEASAQAALKRQAFLDADRFFRLYKTD